MALSYSLWFFLSFFFFLKKFLWHLLWKSLVVMNFLYFCLFKNVLIFTLFLKGTLPDTVFSVDRYFVISTLSRSFHCLIAYISWFKLKNSLIILLRISFMWRVNCVAFKIFFVFTHCLFIMCMVWIFLDLPNFELLSCLDMYIHIFPNIWGVFNHYFFK